MGLVEASQRRETAITLGLPDVYQMTQGTSVEEGTVSLGVSTCHRSYHERVMRKVKAVVQVQS